MSTVRSCLVLVLVLVGGCSGGTHPPVREAPSSVTRPSLRVAKTNPVPTESAVIDARAPVDVQRDADRRPQALMDFFGIEPGQRVVELMAGRGYFTELLAHRVGQTGRVWAQNNRFVLDRFAETPLSERLTKPSLAHVVKLDTELDAPDLPRGVDAILIVLFYHDTYWQQVNREKMNRAVFEALAPGGVYGVVDHHAAAGTKDRDVETLHRVDAELVRGEILSAGFVLDAESDLLRHPEDDRTSNVFDAELRGKTDQFVFRFRKPR